MEKELKPGRFLKKNMLDEYSQSLKGSSSCFVTDFGGLTNKELEDLRKKLNSLSTRYLVVKNSLFRLALKNLKMEGIADMVTGSCALGYGDGDPVSISKVLVQFINNNKNLKLKGGYIDGEIVGVDTIKELAALPSREALLARLVSCINSPVTGFISACSAIVRKLVYALNDIVKKKEER